MATRLRSVITVVAMTNVTPAGSLIPGRPDKKTAWPMCVHSDCIQSTYSTPVCGQVAAATVTLQWVCSLYSFHGVNVILHTLYADCKYRTLHFLSASQPAAVQKKISLEHYHRHACHMAKAALQLLQQPPSRGSCRGGSISLWIESLWDVVHLCEEV